MNWTLVGVELPMVAEALRNAADRVRLYGWYQGRFRDPDSTSTDATQALADVVGVDLVEASQTDRRLEAGAVAMLGAALAAIATVTGAEVLATWNDREDRTPHEVVTLLEQVATICENAVVAR